MGKEQCSSYCIFRSSREGYWRSLKNIYIYIYICIYFLQARSWNGYFQFAALGRDLVGGRDMQRSRPGSEVATWSALVGPKRRHDMDLMSRHGRQCGRSRHGNDVAT